MDRFTPQQGNTYLTPHLPVRSNADPRIVLPVAPGPFVQSTPFITIEDPRLQQIRAELAAWQETEKKRSSLQSTRTTSKKILLSYCGKGTSLFLDYSGITTVPSAIRNLTHLRSLDLSHNGITSISESICTLRGLQSLDLSHNQITSIPNSIGKLGQLKLLCLSDNHLSFLPPEVDGLRKLVVLKLENNFNLEIVPIQLANLHKIIRLTAYNTRIPQELFTAIRTAHEEFRNGCTLRTSPPLLQLWNKYLINNFNLSTFIYALPIGEQLALSKLLEIWDARGDYHTAFAKIQNALWLRYRLSPPPVPHAS